MSPDKTHTPLALVTDDWYVACESRRLGRKPIAITLMGTPLVLYRDGKGRATALLDRCAHRNAPLSLGKVRGEHIECAYHGWQFDGCGSCRVIPGLGGPHDVPGRRVPCYAVSEKSGLVWVYATADVEPVREPFHFKHADEQGYTTVRSEARVAASVFNTAENALDVPHTAYLHGGLFRSSRRKPNEIDVIVRRWHDRVEAEYVGEPRPPGLAGRLLSPRSGVVTHFDRFFLPSIVEVEYEIGRTHICISTAMTPVSDYDTRLFALISFRAPVPGWLVTPFLALLGRRIFAQDARMLRSQTENIRRFGGEHFTTTEVDILGPHVYRLLRQAEQGERAPVEKPFERTVRLLV